MNVPTVACSLGQMDLRFAGLPRRLLSVAAFIFALAIWSIPHSALAIAVGDRVQAIGGWTIRTSAAGTSTGYTTVSGTQGTVLNGPTYAALSGTYYNWYNVNWDSGQDGWSIEASMTTPATPSPTISSVTPNPVTGVALPGRVTLTVNGTNFVNKPTVFLTWTGGSATLSSANTTFISSTKLSISVATDVTPDNWTVKVTNPDGKSSGTVGFQVVAPATPSPTISSVTPNPVTGVALPGRVTLTVNGTNFVNKPTVLLTWTGGSATLSSANTTFISSTKLSISVGTDVTPDNWTVKVTNPDGKSSNTVGFQVVTPATPSPTISSVTPNPVTGVALPGRVILTVNGTSFVNKPTVLLTWTGGSTTLSSANTTFISSTQLSISVATDVTPDNWTVKVTNPDGKSSNTVGFQVVAPATPSPTISSVSPNPVTGVALPGRVILTVNGTNFVNKPTVLLAWTGGSTTLSSANTTFISSTQLSISVATDVTPDNWTVKVTNPDGKSSNTVGFQVVAPATPSPTISSVSPNPVTADAGNAYQTLTIYGSNFINKPSITLTWTGQTGYALPSSQVTFVSSTQLTMSVKLGATADNWTVTATNSDGKASNAVVFTVNIMAVSSDSYEPDDSAATAKTITSGTTQSRNIHTAGNADWAKFTVGSNGATNVVIQTSGSSGDTEMWLYGPSTASTLITYNDDGSGLFSRISLSSLAAGTYYIKVQDYGNNSTIPAYTLNASWTDVATPVSDGNNTSATASVVTNNQTVNAAITPVGDIDWYIFTVGSNGATNVVIQTSGSSGDTEMWLYGSNSASTLVTYNDDGNDLFSRISLSSLAAGTYYIKVGDYGNNSTIPAYTLNASWTDVATPVNDGNNTSTTASVVTNNQAVNAAITPVGDIDWYRFTVGSNGATNAEFQTNGSSGDTEMWLYGPSSASTLVKYNDDSNGLFSRISLSSLAAGTYYIKVQAYGNNSTIPAYTLNASWTDVTTPVNDGNNSSATASVVNNNQTVNAAITPVGDIDWYRFTVGSNGATNAEIQTNGSSGDTEMWLYGPSSASILVTYNDDGNGPFSRISLASLAAGTYYIKVQAYGSYSTIPAYTLNASWIDGVAPSNQLITQTQCIAILGHSVSDSILNDLNACLTRYAINTPVRMRHFISQCAHESIGFTTMIEIASGQAYEGRQDLGNVVPGDGPKFKGAGAIQVTGRNMYQAFANYIGDQQVMQGCQYVAANYPFRISGYWWQQKGMNAFVDSGATCQQVSYRVNGTDPANGLADRQQYYDKCVLAIP